MNTKFFVDCRWYTTPCKTVLNADEFVVEFVTGKHSIVAKVSDKCYFLSIDDTTLSNIKCDFYFERNYNKPKEFLSNLYETFQNFLNTSIPFAKRHFSHSTDDVIRRILELQEMKKEQLENVNENDYAKLEKELIEPEDKHIDDIKKFKEKADLNSSYEEATETKKETATDTETKELLAVEQFERLTGTLYKSLFKAIGLEETCRIPIIISNNMVFFNYNGTQYKYNPAQCKVYKKSGRGYLRINWKDFTDDNSPDDQKQARGRSPPFTPDIRSTTIQ